ncbi:ankyrin repeat-containing domain protein [Colletotrichum cereale]|nr:ankyrin repeat-containing domain protein [Colletotrichum cereale]
MPPRAKNAIIRDEEWMRVQPIIRRLYLLEDRSLKDLIVILSTLHEFRPSKAQLESKLKQWHMTKNMTSMEWKHVDTRIRRRRLQGKESKVYLSGIPLRPATVEKARSRHSFESTLDRIAGKAPPSPKDLSLVIRTPSPPAEVRVCNTYNIPWLLAKDFLRGSNLRALLQSHRSSGWLRPPVEDVLSLTVGNCSELFNHTSKLQYTVQALTLIMPEMILESHVFFAESLLSSPFTNFNDSEVFEVLLFLLSNSFLADAFSIEDQKEEAAVVGLMLNMVKRSRVLDSLATQQLTKLPLSLQSAFNRLFKEAVQRLEFDLIRQLLQIGVDVNQVLPGILREFGDSRAFTAFNYAVLAYDQRLIRLLMDFGADTQTRDVHMIYLAFMRAKTHASASEGSVSLLLSNYSFDPYQANSLDHLFIRLRLYLSCPVSEQIIGFFRAQNLRPKSISVLLVAAIRSQSRLVFDLLSEKRHFINISNRNGETPLTAAVCISSSHLVTHLIQLGANFAPSTQTYEIWPVASPLQCAAFYADLNMIRHLLNDGADINFCYSSDAFYQVDPAVTRTNVYYSENDMNHMGRTALQAAILGSNTEVAMLLLTAGARLVGSELALAIRSRQQIIIDALLARGASLEDNSAALECGSVLEAAVLAEDVELISQIIKANAQAVDEPALWAAIFVAYYTSNMAIIRLLVPAYARKRVFNDLWLGTAVHLAAQFGFCEISEALLTSGTHPAHCWCGFRGPWDDDNAQPQMPEYYLRWRQLILHDQKGIEMSLVHGAAWIGQLEYLKLLLRFGYQLPTHCPKVSILDDTSLELLQILQKHGTKMTQRILSLSIQHGLQPITRWLLSLDIDLNETVLDDERRGRTPIQAAAELGDITLFERLRTLGADINALPNPQGGVTALQVASIKGYFGLVGRLLELHADPNVPGAEIRGRTALEGAAEHGRLDVVQLLLNSGVETYGNGRRQYVRAIEFARQMGHHTAVTLLKSHRPWTEADQEVLEDETLLYFDQTPEGLAKWRKKLDDMRSSIQVEDEDCQAEEPMSEASEETRGLQLINSGSDICEDDPEEACITPLPSSTLEEIRETLRDSDDAPGLPGDAIWAEAYENMTSEYPWLLE